MIHEGLEDGWKFSSADVKRLQLLNKTDEQLKQGIQVKLFQAHRATPMPRISLRLLEAHLHVIKAHPTQPEKGMLQQLVQKSECARMYLLNVYILHVQSGGSWSTVGYVSMCMRMLVMYQDMHVCT